MHPNRPVRVVRSTELAEGQRILKEVFGRSVTLLRHGGKVFCVDAMCSHMGGPLHEGDIEDMPDGSSCIKCPWHSFRFDLASGCRLEKGLCPSEVLRSEPQQRTHPVYNDGDWIWVDLKSHGTVASDAYNDLSTSGAVPLAAEQQAPQQQGFGLGLDEFDDAYLPGSQDSSATAMNSPPQPLTPYSGVDRKPLPPSPVKMAPIRQAPAAAPNRPQAPAAQISFPGRKMTAAALRRAKATQAIQKNTYAPPLVGASAPAQPKRARQARVTDLFGRHASQQLAAIDVDDMDMS